MTLTETTFYFMRDLCLWAGIDTGWLLLVPLLPFFLLFALLYMAFWKAMMDYMSAASCRSDR